MLAFDHLNDMKISVSHLSCKALGRFFTMKKSWINCIKTASVISVAGIRSHVTRRGACNAAVFCLMCFPLNSDDGFL